MGTNRLGWLAWAVGLVACSEGEFSARDQSQAQAGSSSGVGVSSAGQAPTVGGASDSGSGGSTGGLAPSEAGEGGIDSAGSAGESATADGGTGGSVAAGSAGMPLAGSSSGAGAGGACSGCTSGTGGVAGMAGSSSGGSGGSTPSATCPSFTPCAGEADCFATMGSDCGGFFVGRYECSKAVGRYASDGRDFPCVSATDCNEANLAVVSACGEGGSGSGGAGGSSTGGSNSGGSGNVGTSCQPTPACDSPQGCQNLASCSAAGGCDVDIYTCVNVSTYHIVRTTDAVLVQPCGADETGNDCIEARNAAIAHCCVDSR
jgi:hypothetical protein